MKINLKNLENDMLNYYSIDIDMIPVPKQRPRVVYGGKHSYTPKKTVDAEKQIKQAWIDKYGETLIDSPMIVLVINQFTLPKSRPKWQRGLVEKGYYYHDVGKDVDNLAKTVLDGLNNVAYTDDKWVELLISGKKYAEDNVDKVRVAIIELRQNDKETVVSKKKKQFKFFDKIMNKYSE